MLPRISIKDWVIIILAALNIYWCVITVQREYYQPNSLPQLITKAIDENKTKSISVENAEQLLSLLKSELSEDKFQKENSCNSTCYEKHWTHRVNETSVSQSKLLSTCNDPKAFYRGQNVVSFTYYDPGGKDGKSLVPMYQQSMHENIAAIRKYYPGFVMRVYTDAKLEGVLCELVCKYPDLQWCDIKKTPKFGDLSQMYFRTWRYLPLGDPTVNTVLSRDLDSVISEREFGAMRDWFETSEKPISVMRDSHWHDTPILGGTWGASNVMIGDSLATRFQSEIISQSTVPKPDKHHNQHILDNILWPLRKISIVGYDSYYCGKYRREHEVRPYPAQRRKGYAGALFDDHIGNKYLGTRKVRYRPCPLECRPTYGKNWTYC